MSGTPDNDVSDLFGEQLAQPEAPGGPAPFRDGIYVITATGMKKGIYKSGKWTGKPYARFVYELQDGPVKRQVSQMLPWFPGKAFFEINFQRLCGMRLSEFNEHCRRENLNDAKAQSRFFLTLFRGVQYRAEIRQRGEWLNVWELKERIGHPEELPTTIPASPGDATEQSQTAIDLNSSNGSAEVETEATSNENLSEQNFSPTVDTASSIATQFNLPVEQLEALCQEEFGVAANNLSPENQQVLVDLLRERSQF